MTTSGRVKRFVRVALAVALLAPLARPALVAAQPADAIGRPLNDAGLRDGTLSVRVIAGDTSKPVNGTEVALMLTPPDGTSPASELRARTDSDGRVTFSSIPSNTMLQAKVTGEAGEVSSSRFPMPQSGGTKLLLSTLPMAGPMQPSMPSAGGSGPMMGGGGPMAGGGGSGGVQPPMSPRMMSGQPRPQAGDAADSITVRVSYDDFADPAPPKDQPVILVGYRFDMAVAGKMVKTDASGRVTFSGLDKKGATTYFAMTLLPREADHDRLISAPMLLTGDAGIRLMLSGDKRSVGVAVDDQGNIEPQPPEPVPAGEVRVALAGVIQVGDPVELLDALTGKVLVTTKAAPPVPHPDSIKATWGTGADDAVLAPGVLILSVGANGDPAEGATVVVRKKAVPAPVAPAAPAPAAPAPAAPAPAAPAAPAEATSWTGVVDGSGEVTLTGLPTGVELEILVSVDGVTQAPRPLTLPAAGGRREQLAVAWQVRGQASARFTGVEGGPERAFIVRAFLRSQPCLSAPFMMPKSRGVASSLLLFPRMFFAFELDSFINDEYLGTRGTFRLQNTSLAPYVPGTTAKREEFVIPLPRGFIGATVREDFAEMIGVDPSRGFIVRQPVPPGGFAFVAAFSLKTDDGELKWDMELPLGTFESGLAIRRTKDMDLEVPPRTRVREVTEDGNNWYALQPITVAPKQRMVFTLTGLPRRAAWAKWSGRIVGLGVLVVLLGTLTVVLWPRRKKDAPATARSRYEHLIEELAAMGDPEADGGSPGDAARRARIMDELEALHRAGAAGS